MKAIQVIIGWLLDVWLGDPASLPHPVVLFGKMIARGEHALNKGQHRRLKGKPRACAGLIEQRGNLLSVTDVGILGYC